MKAILITVILLIALAVGFASHQASTPSLYAPPMGSSVTAPAHGKAAKMLKVPHLPVHMLGSLLRASNGRNNGDNGGQDQGGTQ